MESQPHLFAAKNFFMSQSLTLLKLFPGCLDLLVKILVGKYERCKQVAKIDADAAWVGIACCGNSDGDVGPPFALNGVCS